MNQMNALVAGGIIYWKMRVIGRAGSIQTEPSPGNSTMLSQAHSIVIEESNANADSQEIPTSVETRPLSNYQKDGGKCNSLEEAVLCGCGKNLTNTRMYKRFSELLLDDLKSILHESQQETANQLSAKLNQITNRMDEAQKMNDAKHSSVKRDLNNIDTKIKKLDEMRILAKTEHHEYNRRLQCIEQKVRKNQFN